ncbi:MAG: hypothetical protein U1E46_15775 [Hyphomicrobiales bacterium]
MADYACPSAQPDMENARVLGVVEATDRGPRVAYLTGREQVHPRALNVPDEMVNLVVRISAKCENARCAQFADGRCGLGERIAKMLPDVVDALPPCNIRRTCRWHAEQGSAICFKCPQVATLVPRDDSDLAQAARPTAQAGV